MIANPCHTLMSGIVMVENNQFACMCVFCISASCEIFCNFKPFWLVLYDIFVVVVYFNKECGRSPKVTMKQFPGAELPSLDHMIGYDQYKYLLMFLSV